MHLYLPVLSVLLHANDCSDNIILELKPTVWLVVSANTNELYGSYSCRHQWSKVLSI